MSPLIRKTPQADNKGALVQAPIVTVSAADKVARTEDEIPVKVEQVTSIEDIEKKIAEMQALKAEHIARIERERIEAEKKKPTKITVDAISGIFLSIKRTDEREDITRIVTEINGARFAGYGYKNALIPLTEWKGFRARIMNEVENAEVKVANQKLKEEIEYLLDTPPWTLGLSERWLIAKWGPGAQSFILNSVPGAQYDYAKQLVKIPLTEAHTAYGRLEKVEGVVWNEDAQAYVISQINKRMRLDEVALKEKSDIYGPLSYNGVTLRDFQGVGCEFIDCAGGNALIADEMGLGKTYQALFYAKHNEFKKVLIVCQAALKPKWAREVKKIYGDDVKYYVPNASKPGEMDILALFQNKVQVVIINYDLLGEFTQGIKEGVNENGYNTKEKMESYMWAELLRVWKPDVMIVDESHYAKNVDAHRTRALLKVKAERTICMSGTPVLNRPGELWTTLHMVAPEQFPAYETFLHQYTWDGKRARNVEELRNILKSVMIRRLKKDVMKELPPINRITEWHTLTPRAQKLYEKVMMGVYEMVAEYNPSAAGSQQAITNILAKIMRCKQICAISKVEQTAELAEQLYDQTDESSHRKVLIFTQFKGTCYRIAQLLGKDVEALSFVNYNKSSGDFVTVDNNERDRLVQQFQNDPSIKYLVVTEKTAKEGHNITAAGHVIFNDLFWTPAAHEQSEGRAYGRLNDPHPINSYWMVTDMGGDGIEEWIMQMLQSKMSVINETVEGINDERDVSIATDLIRKIKESMYIQRKGR